MRVRRSVGRGGSSDHVALGRAVRELRKCRHVSQDVLAFDAGMHRNNLGMIERGEVNPSFVMLLCIVRTLGATMPDLIALYERHLTEIDPKAGQDVPLCPTPEALAYARQLNAQQNAKNLAAKARGRIKPWT